MALGRTELKHQINALDCYVLRTKLNALLTHDPHAGPTGIYKISSLYFDNPDGKALMEKVNGTDHRIKFRIRCYGDRRDLLNLEKKSKHGTLCYKEKCNMAPREVQMLSAGDISWMPNDSRKLIRELYINMTVYKIKPKTIIQYTREAFIYHYGNVRITLDSDVRTSLNQTDLFDNHVLFVPVNEPGHTILEVKYDEYLPEVIKGLLQIDNRRAQSNSKYMQGRIYC